jgi:hypothetical protein
MLLYCSTGLRPRLRVAVIALASLTSVYWVFDTTTRVQSQVDLDWKTLSDDTIQNLIHEMCMSNPMLFSTEEVVIANPYLHIGSILL